MRIKLYAGREENDHEKAVLPTIIYVHQKSDKRNANMFLIGWWHWFVGIAFVTKISAQ